MRYVCIAIKSYEYCFLSQSMQRRDSLGSTTKIPRLSKGSTRKFKTRRSQSSFSSASDVFAETESTKGQPDLSVSEMAIKGKAPKPEPRAKRLWTPLTKENGRLFDPTLSQARTSSGRKSRGRRRPRSVLRSSRDRKCYSKECPNRRPRVIGGGENIHIRLIPTHLWPSRATTR